MESVILHVKQQFGEETDGLSIPPRFPDPAQTPAGGPPGLSFALLSHCDAPFLEKREMLIFFFFFYKYLAFSCPTDVVNLKRAGGGVGDLRDSPLKVCY